MASTFLKWAGGKKWLLKYLPEIVGNIQINNYHEPFLGGGAIFFSLEPNNEKFLSDLNEELINTYLNVRDFPNEILNFLENYEDTREFYYDMRARQNIPDSIERAARFIYLNKTSFNGIYRVNRQGEYNVPYGSKQGNFFEPNKILDASRCLQNANIQTGDFMINRNNIQEGDLVFLDPPYTVSRKYQENGFIEYNQTLFSMTDQMRLAEYIEFINQANAYYILTNAAHPSILELFNNGARLLERERASLIGGQNAQRGKVNEYIFTNIRG